MLLDILGLSYDDFTKAVILPQGKFNEFLSLKNSDKGEMLGRIFSLEKYGKELSNKFNKEKSDTNNKINIINSNIETIGEISNLKEFKEIIKENKVNKKEKDLLIIEKQRQLNGQKEFYKVFNEHYKIENRLNELLKKEETFKKLEEDIDKYKNAKSINIKISKDKSLEMEINKLKDNENKTKEEKEKLEREKEKLTIREELFSKEKEIEYNDNLKKIAEIQSLIVENEELENDKKVQLKLREDYKTNKKMQKDLVLEQQKIIDSIKQLTEQEKILGQKIVDNTLKYDYILLINDGEKINLDIKNIDEKINKLREELNLLEQNKKSIDENLNILEKSKNSLEQKESLQKEDKKIYYSFMLKKQLKEGDICPICGDEITTIIDSNSSEKNFDENIENELKDILIKMAEHKSNITNLTKEYKKIDNQILELEKEKKELSEKIDDIKTKSNVSDFAQEQKEIKKKQKLFDELSNEIKEIENNLKKSNESQLNINMRLNEIEIVLNKILSDGNYISEKVSKIEKKISDKTDGMPVKDYLIKLENRRDYFINEDKKINEDKNKLNTLINEFNLKITSIKSDILNNEKTRFEIVKEIDNDIKRFGFIDKKQIDEFLSTDEEIAKILIDIQDYKNELHLVKENKKEIAKQLIVFDEHYQTVDILSLDKNISRLETEVETLKIEIDELIKSISKLETEYKISEENNKKVKELEKEVKLLVKKSDYLEIICSVLSGNKFVQFIAKRYLIQICLDASNRLYTMSGRKYSLILDETDFLIVDHFRGNIKRAVKSISGGEQFMVSLCLALSLSTYISRKNNGTMDMFFLDEGFGSLDDETLETVVDLLFKASNDELSIGLITHVSKLQEDLPKKLEVSIDENTYSSVIALK